MKVSKFFFSLPLLFTFAAFSYGQALESYLAIPQPKFEWSKSLDVQRAEEREVLLELVSQEWRGILWKHQLRVIIPKNLRRRDSAFLFIRGSGDGTAQVSFLSRMAAATGIPAAVLCDVPNQPLFGDRKEDSLIAYTLEQYRRTGDRTWPLLFPMVRSGVAAMDALVEFGLTENLELQKFVIHGASKRGWTSWLLASVDNRVHALVPQVFDMLHFEAQTSWAKAVYGKQSDEISEYTELGLVDRLQDPRVRELKHWIDPFYVLPKIQQPVLIALGTNDPYWVVDSVQHYWQFIKSTKALAQAFNSGHDLGTSVEPTLVAFVRAVTGEGEIPQIIWSATGREIHLQWSSPPTKVLAWEAFSDDGDFRKAQWVPTAQILAPALGKAVVSLPQHERPWRAVIYEFQYMAAGVGTYSLHSEAFVTGKTGPIRRGNHREGALLPHAKVP